MPVDSTCYLSNINSINEIPISLFDIYPNPTSGKFILHGIDEKYNLIIFNVFGEKVFHSLISDMQYALDLSSQPDGIYYIKIICQDGNSAVKKIVKE